MSASLLATLPVLLTSKSLFKLEPVETKDYWTISGNTLDVELIQAMPSLHAIFGCDSVSAVHGVGKMKWLSTVENKEEHLQVLADIGTSVVIDQTIHWSIEKMFCAMYGNPKETNINRL